MKRVSDGLFIEANYNKDSIVGIRIKDGDFYLIGYMEDAGKYSFVIPKCWEDTVINRESVVVCGMICAENLDSPAYICTEKENENPYEAFLGYIKPYERNGISDGDHDIFEVSKDDLSNIIDALRDGDYVFVLKDSGMFEVN